MLDPAVFVPVPPSKARDDGAYDDRLVRMLRSKRAGATAVRAGVDRADAQGGADAPAVYATAGLMVVVHDLLSSGVHFRAAQRLLSRRFPVIDVAGLFLARGVPEVVAP